jgi:hypothetical protein
MSLPVAPFTWLRRAGGRRAFWLVLPLVLYLPSIAGPFVFDDLWLVLQSERYARGESSRLDLFRFARTDQAWQGLRDRGTVPWWGPAKVRIDFFRPLAEWSFYLDMLVFGRHAVGHRLMSLMWFAVALCCTKKLFDSASHDPNRAGVATFCWGISQTVAQPVALINNRSDLLVVVGITFAAWAYLTAERRSTRGGVIIAGAASVFALLAKEIAVGFAGVLVLQEIINRWRGGDRRTGGGRLGIAMVVAVLTGLYLIYFAATRPWHLGLGTEAELSNVSMLSRAYRAIPLYLAVWSISFPITVLFNADAALVAVVGGLGLLVAALVVWHLVRVRDGSQGETFFALWAMVFLGIALLTLTDTRALCVATVGWAYLLSGLLVPLKEREHRVPSWLRYWLLTAAGPISICNVLGMVVMLTRFEYQQRANLQEYLAAQDRPLQAGDTLIVAEARSILEVPLAGDRLEFLTGVPRVGVAFLSLPGAGAHIEHRDDHALVLKSSSGDLLDKRLYELGRGEDWRRQLGKTFETRTFVAEVNGVTPDGRIESLIFRFQEPLRSPRLRFYPPQLSAIARAER